MAKVRKNSWRRNHGNKLIAIGLAAALVMSAINYFNLVPEIEILQEQSSELPRLIGPQLQRSQLVVVVTGPDQYDGRLVRGTVAVYEPNGTLSPTNSPILAQAFELDSEGYGTLAIDLPNVETFTVVCHLDLNDNGQLDYSDEGYPTEPLRLSARPTTAPASVSLESEQVTAPQSTMLIVHMVFPKENIAGENMAARQRKNLGKRGSPNR